jgi:hypothetical protein
LKSKSIVSPNSLQASVQNKKPAGAYRASGPMSANFDALLKPPRARSYAVMVMMPVVSRGEIHGKKEYTRAGDSRQEM